MEARADPVMVKVALAVWPLSVPVTVWAPASVAVQEASVQLPLGVMVKVVAPVTSPSELAKAS